MTGGSRQGKAWSSDEDRMLYDAIVLHGKTIKECAELHQRSTGGIRARLRRLGLLDNTGQFVVPPPPFGKALRRKRTTTTLADTGANLMDQVVLQLVDRVAPKNRKAIVAPQRLDSSVGDVPRDVPLRRFVRERVSVAIADHKRHIVGIDFETANKSPASACAVGLSWMDDGEVSWIEERLILPPVIKFHWANSKVHGIKERDVSKQPLFPEILGEFAAHLDGALFVAHHANFDMRVWQALFDFYDLPPMNVRFLCTLEVARQVWPTLGCFTLESIAAHLGLELDHHRAGSDAATAVRIALAAAKALGVPRVSDIPSCTGLQLSKLGGDSILRSARASEQATGTPTIIRSRSGDLVMPIVEKTDLIGTHCTVEPLDALEAAIATGTLTRLASGEWGGRYNGVGQDKAVDRIDKLAVEYCVSQGWLVSHPCAIRNDAQ